MASWIEARIEAVDAATLTPIVQRALGSTDGELVEWTCEPLRPTLGNWGPSVIYRFSGTARRQNATLPWSLVLKVSCGTIGVVGDRQRADDTRIQREAAFYRSDLIRDFPAGFRHSPAPAGNDCFHNLAVRLHGVDRYFLYHDVHNDRASHAGH